MTRNNIVVQATYLFFASVVLSLVLSPRVINASQLIKGSSNFFVFQDDETHYYGIKTASGSIALPARFDKIFAEVGSPVFVDAPYDAAKESEYSLPGMIAVMKGKRVWWVDAKGGELFESFFFDNGPDYFVKGLSRILKGDKFGFIDKKGRVVIQPQYDFASPFDDNGFSSVCQGCWMLYPPDTKFPIAHRDVPSDVYGTLTGGKWGVISSNGQVVVPLKYDSSKETMEVLKEIKETKRR